MAYPESGVVAPWRTPTRTGIQTLVDSIIFDAYRWRYYYRDIVPILLKYKTKQAVRDLVWQLPLLTVGEKQRIRAWMRRHGW
jgi:hypothetical protein